MAAAAAVTDYGGYVAIGYNSDKVKTPPTSFADLLKPEYKNQVAINGNPTQAERQGPQDRVPSDASYAA